MKTWLKPRISHVRPGFIASAKCVMAYVKTLKVPTARHSGENKNVQHLTPFIIVSHVGDVNGWGEQIHLDNVYVLTAEGIGWCNFSSDEITRI